MNNQTAPPQQLSAEDREKVLAALPPEIVATLHTFPRLFLAGGAIRAILAGEAVKDIDLFFTDLDSVVDAVRFYIFQCGDRGMIEVVTPCTITVKGTGMAPVQFINNLAYASPVDCVDKFDFTICQAALWYEPEDYDWHTYCSPEFTRDVATKRLVYTAPNRVEAPGGSLWRAFKYARSGYSITQRELARLVARLCSALIADAVANPPDLDWDDDAAVEAESVERVVQTFRMPGRFGGIY